MRNQVSSTAAFVAAACSLAALEVSAAPPSTSAYATDPQNSYVQDATSERIGQVNMITCIMSALRADALVNEGNYIALVDQSKCDAAKRSVGAGGAGSDAATQAPTYMTAVVNSTRASNSDPMRAKVWINDVEGQGQQVTIFVNVSASAPPTDANPYGIFRLDFCGRVDGVSQCVMHGYLQGSDAGVNYYQSEQGDNGEEITALKLNATGSSSGSGRLDATGTDNGVPQEVIFNFAYNQNYFLRDDQCFSRDASDPDTGLSVWRYGVYDSVTGDRIARNSGFPIDYTAGGQTYHGYLGYWGLNLPPDAMATLTNGSTVQKVDYSSGNSPTKTDYTVTMSGGKLTKYTKKTSTLQALDKIKFTTFVNNVTGFIPNAQPNTQYEMYWDDGAARFKVTGSVVCDQSGCQTHDLDTEQAVGASFWAAQGGIQGWSQSLGGDLFINLNGAGDSLASASIGVIYRAQDLVYPSDMPNALYCVNNCPTAAALQAYFTGVSQGPSAMPYAAGTGNNFSPSATYVTYGSDKNAGVLTNGGQAVVYTDSSAYQQHPQYQGGVRSGRLFTNPTDAVCPNNSSMYCDYQVNNADVYYVWETGPNNFNQFAAVKDSSGAFVTFDAPLQLNYTVPTGSAYGVYAGKSIVLQYGGFGDLGGIPGYCVSPVTNEVVKCGNNGGDRYVPSFAIPAGDQATAGNNTYLVKWLEREIRFANKPLSVCQNANLTAPTGIVLPTATDLKDPSDPSSDIYIGDKPSITDAPRVIHGDVKY